MRKLLVMVGLIVLVIPILLVVLVWDQTVERIRLWWFWRKPRQRHYCLALPPGHEPEFDGPKSWPWMLWAK